MLQGSFLLGSDVLLLCVVPELLQAWSGQRDAGSRCVHGLALHQPPPLPLQLGQDRHPCLVREGLSLRIYVRAHVCVASKMRVKPKTTLIIILTNVISLTLAVSLSLYLLVCPSAQLNCGTGGYQTTIKVPRIVSVT